MQTKITLLAATLTLAAAATAGAQVTVPLGTATGGIGVYFNNNGAGETAGNISYYQFQTSLTNTNGAPFQFDNTDLDPLTAGNQSFNELFSGQPVGQSQFGLDAVVSQPTADSSAPAPTLTAYDNTNNSVSGRSADGTVDFAFDDYKGGTPTGPTLASNQVINSALRGGAINITSQTLTNVGPIFTLTIAGNLVTDGNIYYYNPAFGTGTLASFGIDDTFTFAGTLTYDASSDSSSNLVDFYEGDVRFTATVSAVPEPTSLGLLGVAGLGLLRRRRAAH